MSWSCNIVATGKNLPPLIDKSFTHECVEPEETIRELLMQAAKQAAESAPNLVFMLDFYGSMSYQSDGQGKVTSIGNHNFKIELKTFQLQE